MVFPGAPTRPAMAPPSIAVLASSPAVQRRESSSSPSPSPLSPGVFSFAKPSFVAGFRASPASFGRRPWRRRRGDPVPAAGLLSPLPPSNPGRSSQDQRPRVPHTPSGATLLKSPPRIVILCPQSSAREEFQNFYIYLNPFKSCFIYRIATALFWP